MRRFLTMPVLFLTLFIGCLSTALAQKTSGESELGANGSYKPRFFSQYIFYEDKSWHAFVRYQWVRDILHRGEVAIGPMIKFDDGNMKLWMGLTTDDEFMLGTSLQSKPIYYKIDFKAGMISRKNPNTVHQKFLLALDEHNIWQLRFEHLQEETLLGFLRLGVEYQYQLTDQSHTYIAPFIDPTSDRWFGGQVGFRFF
ncbi:hypothetical protein HY967_04985 [Candidatus Jorgensenbacteria bacterium]|nr:hypothetical protein [Candidatus Jorgensenbacteria bacterium]